VKAFECGRAIEAGAEEIDTVLAPGGVMEREYDGIFEELLTLRAACPGVTLKVIIEAGELKSDEDVFNATLLCAYAGADFVKTSTGKTPVGATPGAVRVMCEAVRQYHAREGRRVGIKVAGGVATADDALSYMQIVRRVLGDAWLSPRLFRLGASRLLDALVEAYRV
jgi:deoxyribose-phosphate aldolase